MKALNDTIILSSPNITEREIELVNQVLRQDRPSEGSMIERFEVAVADFVGARYAVAVSSGTAGLHLAALAARLGPGDAVITTPFSSIASANCVLYVEATPIFVDIDPHTLNLDPALVAQAAGDLAAGCVAARRWLPLADRNSESTIRNLKAILPVHVFGHPCAMDSLMEIAQKHNMVVIEDAREALGTRFQGQPAGTFGACGVFSFSPGKQVTTGEGGMLITEDDEWAALFRSLRNQGRDDAGPVLNLSAGLGTNSAEGLDTDPGTWPRHVRLGYDYRMHELSAALGVAQMERFEELLARREQVAGWYTEQLTGIDGVQAPRITPEVTRMSWFAYVVRLAPELDRDRIIKALAGRDVPARPYFTPLHLQPLYRERFGFREGDFPITERVARSTMALPFSNRMNREQAEQVCRALRDVL